MTSPFGLLNGDLVTIDQVSRGLACGCVCTECKHPLVAKKGEYKEHHFAHRKASNCKMSVETALHIAAKNILAEAKKLSLPPVVAPVRFNGINELSLFPTSEHTFDTVELEYRTNNIIPDIVLEKNGVKLFVEITVTHPVSFEKQTKIEGLGISTLEINLSKWCRDFDMDTLRNEVVEAIGNKRWIYNRHSASFLRKIYADERRIRVTSRGMADHVDYCPIQARMWRGKPYANVIDNCWHCDYHLGTETNDYGGMTFIHCVGHNRAYVDEQIRLASNSYLIYPQMNLERG